MKHFGLNEFVRSDTAREFGLDNMPGESAIMALELLVARVLDPLREWWGGQVRVTSGYRSEAVNRLVGGVASSQHRLGEAADITVGTAAGNRRIFDHIRHALPFDQLIWEGGGEEGPAWVHVSYRAGRLRRQVVGDPRR